MIPVAVVLGVFAALFYSLIPKKTADGESVSTVPPTPGTPLVYAPAPVVKPIPQDPVIYGPDATGEPRGIRNNNPLNITNTGDMWEGMIGTDDKFIRFNYPQEGLRCATIVLKHTYFDHGRNTIRSIIEKFAPATDSNDVDAYCQSVADAMKLGEYDPMVFEIHVYRLLQVMGNVEQGKPLTHWYTQTQIADGYHRGLVALGLA